MVSQPLRPCPLEVAAESLFINHPFPVKSSPWQGHALSLAPRYGTENIGNFSRGEGGPLCSLLGQGEQLCGRCGSQRGGRESSRDGVWASAQGKGLALAPWPGQDTLWGFCGAWPVGFLFLPERLGAVGVKEAARQPGRLKAPRCLPRSRSTRCPNASSD